MVTGLFVVKILFLNKCGKDQEALAGNLMQSNREIDKMTFSNLQSWHRIFLTVKPTPSPTTSPHSAFYILGQRPFLLHRFLSLD